MIYYFNQFQYVNELCQSHRMAKTIQLNLTSGG